MSEKVICRETCKSCKVVKDVTMLTMAECIGCGQHVCLECACSDTETELFIETTGKGTITQGHDDPDLNGPCGWLCPKCFRKQFGKEPKRSSWTNDSHSSGETQKSGKKTKKK